MNSLADIGPSPSGRRHLTGLLACLVLAGLAAPGTAADYTWSNGTTSGDWNATGNWSPAGTPTAGDTVFMDVNLDSPTAPSGTNVAWLNVGTTAAKILNIGSMLFTGTAPKYAWNSNPIVTATQTAPTTSNTLYVSGSIVAQAGSGPVFFGNSTSGTMTRNLNLRPLSSGTGLAIVNHSANSMTFGTGTGGTVDPTTYVGGSPTQTGFVLNGGSTNTGSAMVIAITTDGGGNVVFNNNVQNSTSGIRLVVDASNGGKVVTKTLAVGLNAGANPSIAVNSGTLEFQGQAFTDSSFATSGAVAIASGARLTVNRSPAQGAIAVSANMQGAGVFEVAGGSEWQQTGSLNQSGGTVISSGTLTLSFVPAMTGPTSIAGGSVLKSVQNTNTTIAGPITGAGRFWKGGSGTTTLAGSNSFTGGIQIDSSAGVGGVAMQQLDVSQLITGTVPGTLAVAGDTGGTLDVSPATAGGLAFRLGSVGSSDLVTVPGFLQLGTGTLGFTTFSFSTAAGFGPGTYTLFSATTGLLGSLGSGTTGSIGTSYAGLLQTAGNTLQLVVTAVPEPSTTAALVSGLVTGGIVLRRRRS